MSQFFKSFFYVSLFAMVFLSAGCSAVPQKNIVMDASKWREETLLKGVTFAYPPELQYVVGGGTDGFGNSAIIDPVSEKLYFVITEFVLNKCAPEHDPGCGLDEMVAATPQEVFESQVKDSSENEWYTAAGDVEVGDMMGKRFVWNEQNQDGSSRVKVVFASSEGVYTLEDVRQNGAGDALFTQFLGTFRDAPGVENVDR